MEWKDVLMNNGFTLYEKCNCHGAYTEKYVHEDKVFKISAFPSKRLFNLYKHGFFQKKTFLFKLEQTLKDYGIIIEVIEP